MTRWFHFCYCCWFAVALLFAAGLPAFATGESTVSTETPSKTFGEATSSILGLHETLIELMQLIVGFAALFSGFMISLKVMKGDRESSEKLLHLVVYLAIGFVLLTILKSINWTGAVAYENPGDGFGDIRAGLAGFMMAILSIVIVVCLTVALVHILNGDKESVKKLINWLAGSLTGFILLDIIANLSL